MFSSTNSTAYPFQHLPSLFHHHHHHHHSPPFLPHESDDSFLNHHNNNNDFFVGHTHFPPPPPPPPNASLSEAVINMSVSNNPIPTMTHQDCYVPSNFLSVKKPVKKDRHSKITTAKGPRERRVRLSIKIARKFFDLQDMLGFDKASRTLEWLLMKSKTAIKEVVRMKLTCNDGGKSLSPASECEVVSEMNDPDASESGDPFGMKSAAEGRVSKERKMKEANKAAFQLLARESRAKARARARERTREKMCSRRLDELKKFPDVNHHFHSQLRSSTQPLAHDKSGSSSSLKLVAQVEESSSRPLPNPARREDIIEESIVIKRKLKPSPLFSCPQHLLFPKDLSLKSNNNNGNGYFPHPPQNWDINTPSVRSNSFCAMTNMNLSTEVQMFGKPWEAHNNLSLR